VDRAQFFPLAGAKIKLKKSQWPLVERLVAVLAQRP
jgi:predicted NUDIX family NTP pyrophosphohydrolase